MQNAECKMQNFGEDVSAQAEKVTASDSIPAQEDSSACSSAPCADVSEEGARSPSDNTACTEGATSLAEGEADGNITAEGDITADGNITAEGDITAEGNVSAEGNISAEGTLVDYARQAEADMQELCAIFPTLAPDGRQLDLGELQNPTRFAELRAAGLTAEEAFLASNYRMLTASVPAPEATRKSTAHLRPALPRTDGLARTMPASLLVRTRTLFEGLSDRELASLYRRVTE